MLVGDSLQRSGTDIEERKSNDSMDSLNQRAPIGIIEYLNWNIYV